MSEQTDANPRQWERDIRDRARSRKLIAVADVQFLLRQLVAARAALDARDARIKELEAGLKRITELPTYDKDYNGMMERQDTTWPSLLMTTGGDWLDTTDLTDVLRPLLSAATPSDHRENDGPANSI